MEQKKGMFEQVVKGGHQPTMETPQRKETENSGKNYWIFQSSEDRYDFSDPNLLQSGSTGWWDVSRYPEELKEGDIVFFWLDGEKDVRGIYGWGELSGSTYTSEEKGRYRVNYICNERFAPHIELNRIKNNERLAGLSILNNPQGNNFPITEEESEAIFNLARIPEPVKFNLDTAAIKDLLGRQGYADALANWIGRFWNEKNSNKPAGNEHSFIMHLHGRWGSGKTTILNLLENSLKGGAEEGGKPWVVVHFNAWENCHTQPVWWPLLKKFYKESFRQVYKNQGPGRALKIWRHNFLWKLISGNKTNGYIFIFFSVLLLIVTVLSPDLTEADHAQWGLIIFDQYELIIQMGTGLAALVSGFTYFFRSMIWGSAESAKEYLELNEDPLIQVKKYFKKIANYANCPVMIYIDDLDRCNASYVVNLLEDIQTLFKDSRVFYLVAADKRWIYSSFENRYKEFANHVEEPGKELGNLFTDKIFQLSVSVPKISPEIKKAYLNRLYSGKSEMDRESLREIAEKARREFAGVSSQAEIVERLDMQEGDEFEKEIKLQEGIRALSKKAVEQSNEYFLTQFAHLLEPNPRSIKRLVNTYGIQSIIILTSNRDLIGSSENRKKFALWNILKMRWPIIAEYMEENYDRLEDLFEPGGKDLPEDEGFIKIKKLMDQPEVRQVLKGKGMGVNLDKGYIGKIVKIELDEEVNLLD